MAILDINQLGQVGLIQDTAPELLPPNGVSLAKNIRFVDGGAEKMTGEVVFQTPPAGWDNGGDQVYWALPVFNCDTEEYLWLYAGIDRVYVWDGLVHTEIGYRRVITPTSWSGGTPVVVTFAGDTDTIYQTGDKVLIEGHSVGAINGEWTVTRIGDIQFTLDGSSTTPGTGGTFKFLNQYGSSADINWTGGIIAGIPVINNGISPPQMWNLPDPDQGLDELTAWPAGYTCRTMRVFKNYLIAANVHDGLNRFPTLI